MGLRPGRAGPRAQGRGSGRCRDRMRGRNRLVDRAAGGQGERDAQPVRVIEAALHGGDAGGGDSVHEGEAEAVTGRAAPARRAAVEAVEDAGDLIFFFNDTATTEIYTLSLHDALPI